MKIDEFETTNCPICKRTLIKYDQSGHSVEYYCNNIIDNMDEYSVFGYYDSNEVSQSLTFGKYRLYINSLDDTMCITTYDSLEDVIDIQKICIDKYTDFKALEIRIDKLRNFQ